MISITDGQVYLAPDLFQKGILPAVDVGRSVSRVGGKAQLAAYRSVAGDLRLSYSQFEELEAFSRFSSRLDDATRGTLERGRRVREILKQSESHPLSAAEQIAVLVAVSSGLLDNLPVDKMREAETVVRDAVSSNLPQVCEHIQAGRKLDDTHIAQIVEVARTALEEAVLSVASDQSESA